MNSAEKEIECPGCGKKARVNLPRNTRYKDFKCPECTTPFSITFETDEKDNLMSFVLARDIEG